MELNNYAVGKILEVSKREWEGMEGKGVTYTITFAPEGVEEKNAVFIQTLRKDHREVIDALKPNDQVAVDFILKGKSFTSKSGALFKMNELWLSNIQVALPANDVGLEESEIPF